MEEIKEPLHKRIKEFIVAHATAIGIILFVVVVLFSSCGKVKAADSYPDNPFNGGNVQTPSVTFEGDFWAAYDALVGNRFTQEFQNNINSIMERGYTKYMFFHDSQDMMSFLLLPEETVGVYYYWGDSRYFTPYYSEYSWHVNNRENYLGYNIKLNPNSNVLFCQIMGLYASSMTPYTYNILNTPVYSFSYYGADQIYYYKGGNGSIGAAWYGGNLTPPSLANWNYRTSFNTTAQWGAFASNFTVMCSTTGSLSDSNPIKTNNINGILYTTDSRLRLYKTSTTYGDTLNIDISRLIEDFPIEIPHQGDARLVPKEITLTINSNNTDYTYIVDASTGLWENNSTLAQVPYQWFLDADIPLQNAVITQCSFTLQASNDTQQTVSYDYYIACSYNISNQSDIIVPDIVPNPTYNNTEIIDNTNMTNIVNNLNNVSSQYNDNTGSWVYLQSLPTFPSWASVDAINAFTTDGSKFYTYEGSIIYKYVDDDYAINFGNYVYDNATSMYYDIIYFRVSSADFPAITTNDTPPDSTTFLGYLVFYSQRYYLRYDVYNQLSLIEAIQAEAENAKTFYTTVKTVLDNFDTQTIEAFNNLIGIGNTANGWFATLDNSISTGVSKIVTAIENIDGFSFDDSGIIGKLDTIISNQNSTKDGYALYIAWVKDSINSSGLHTWANGIIDSLKKAFTFLVPTDLDSAEDGAQTYIWYSNKFFDFVFGDERLTTYLQNDTINIYSYTGGYTYE